MSADLTGQQLGHYQVLAVLGTGGMSTVYRAVDTRLDRPVALKVISENLSSDEEFRQRFVEEARAASAIDHVNVVPLYDFGAAGDDGKWLYIAMRLVEGTDLAQEIAKGPLPPRRAIDLLGQAGGALDMLHERGLVHLDVKPANVLITRSESLGKEHVYLADFGLTRRGATGHRTASGDFLGSPTYASPEHLRGEEVHASSDLYSLTCVLFTCLAGRAPFTGTVKEVVTGHLRGQVPSLSALTGLPSAIDRVIARGLAADPGSRYGSSAELLGSARRAVTAYDDEQPTRRAGSTTGQGAAAAGSAAAGSAAAGSAAAGSAASGPSAPGSAGAGSAEAGSAAAGTASSPHEPAHQARHSDSSRPGGPAQAENRAGPQHGAGAAPWGAGSGGPSTDSTTAIPGAREPDTDLNLPGLSAFRGGPPDDGDPDRTGPTALGGNEPAAGRGNRRAWGWVLAGLLALLAIGLVTFLLVRSGDDPQTPQTPPSSAVVTSGPPSSDEPTTSEQGSTTESAVVPPSSPDPSSVQPPSTTPGPSTPPSTSRPPTTRGSGNSGLPTLIDPSQITNFNPSQLSIPPLTPGSSG